MLAGAWQTGPNDVNEYDDLVDLADNNSIDYNDLALFCEDWLWKKGWEEGWMMAMGGGAGGFSLESVAAQSIFAFDLLLPAASGEKDTLILLTPNEILNAKSPELAERIDKYYALIPETISGPEPLIARSRRELITLQQQVLEWLDEIWLNSNLNDSMSENDYLEFRNAIEKALSNTHI
ncbi:MAG: hypothetical protein ABIG61_16360 [Planctomycetota bacterium]